MSAPDPFARPEELLRRVYGYVAYRVHDRAEAEDITSEAFERALRYRKTYDPRKGTPDAWLLGIARRCIYDAAQRPTNEPEVDPPSPAGEVEGQVVLRTALAEALSTLPPADRDLIALRYGADLSSKQIGRLLEMRTNAVDVALSRARVRLRAALEGDAGTGRSAVGGLADEPL